MEEVKACSHGDIHVLTLFLTIVDTLLMTKDSSEITC